MTRVEIAVSSGLLRVARNGGGYFAPLPLLFPKIFCKQNIFGNPLHGTQRTIAKFSQADGEEIL